MSRIPKTKFQIPTLSNKKYNKYPKEKNKNINLYMSSKKTYTNQTNNSTLDNNSYPHEKEAPSNDSTPCKKTKCLFHKQTFEST